MAGPEIKNSNGGQFVKILIICGIVAELVSKLQAGSTSPLQAIDVGISGETSPSLVTADPSGNDLGRGGTKRVGGR